MFRVGTIFLLSRRRTAAIPSYCRRRRSLLVSAPKTTAAAAPTAASSSSSSSSSIAKIKKLPRAVGIGSAAAAAAAVALITTTTTTCYWLYDTDSGAAGLRRELYFWRRVGPVVADYYLQTSSNSPLVRFHNWRSSSGQNNNDDDDNDESSQQQQQQQQQSSQKNQKKKKQQQLLLLQQLHEKHAPTIFQTMLDLKGLYVKLGQVLSVTALPVPETYRILFRTLQSDVPGYETFDEVVKPVLEKEFGAGRPINEIFEYVDPIPCGAASIGQAHRAKLKRRPSKSDAESTTGDDVIIKVQYPDASWQVPADIQCVGGFLKVCVSFGVVDESSAKMSFDEFARQFLNELDYQREVRNLQTVYASSLDPSAPYMKRNVVIPQVYEDLCTSKVITMTYLPGPKLESEAKRQLEALGIDTSQNIASIVRQTAKEAADPTEPESGELVRRITKRMGKEDEEHGDNVDRVPSSSTAAAALPKANDNNNKKLPPASMISWKLTASRIVGNVVGVDSILWMVRFVRKLWLWSEAAAVASIHNTAVPLAAILPKSWEEWADSHKHAALQAQRLSLTKEWMDALFDVHGHQVFCLGLFNADPHPGNILVIEEEDDQDKPSNKLGLIDYGQCKSLEASEQIRIAQLVLSVANNESDLAVATAFRNLGIKTSNDSTSFLAKFGRLMLGPLKPEYFDHSWHRKLHKQDRVLYFPKELSMVYRTSLLLRGLAVSLQLNYSIADQWKEHAQSAINNNPRIVEQLVNVGRTQEAN